MKIAIVSSGSDKAELCHAELRKEYRIFDPGDAEVILALGGDGLMLHSMHQFLELDRPIYGINCGTVGFLMNELSKKNLFERIDEAESTEVFPLEMEATLLDGSKQTKIAFNEVSLIRYSHQSANLSIRINGVERISRLICDGVLVSTPMGSTAYNLSARGPILPLESKILALTPVSPFRPRRWSGALLPSSSIVELTNLDPGKRPIGASADFFEVKDAVTITVRENRERPFRVLFDSSHSLEERIFNEQFAH